MAPSTEHSNWPRPVRRPRRLRRSEALRGLVRECRLTPDRLVYPVFVVDGDGRAEPIEAMPGQFLLSVDELIERCREAWNLGIRAFALFPRIEPKRKDPQAGEALCEDNVLCRCVRKLKEALPEACVITDVALDPYSSYGHDGLVDARGEVANDATVELLARVAVLHARIGADVVAPSDMMDGRVAAIRGALDGGGFDDVAIISYCTKYASAFYGPFREALGSAPVELPNVPKDKSSYQMDPANGREAELEAALDDAEGADILMVKPAMPYLDIVSRLRAASRLPVAAFQVSGEYAMIKAAAQRGWLDERECMTEALTAIARAGSDVIFTYAACEFAEWCRDSAL